MRKSEVNPFQALGILEKSAELKIPQEQKRPANHVCSIYDNQIEKLSGLETLVELNVLSFGKNKIRSHEECV
jgi:hypothetical protein